LAAFEQHEGDDGRDLDAQQALVRLG